MLPTQATLKPDRKAPHKRSALARALMRVADLVLPPLCLSCRQRVDRHGELCPTCWAGVDFIQPPICDRLGIPLPYGTGETQLSAAALASPPAYDRARAVARYSGVMRSAIHDFKFRDRHEGRKLFARWLANAGADILEGADCLIPVPLYRTRLWHRRFNQSAILAHDISAITRVPCDPFLLKRTRPTAKQVGLSQDQRSRNVSGAFAIAKGRQGEVAGRRTVLVDDVLTTGATVSACARILRRAGAESVDVLVLARVVDPAVPTP